MRKGPRCILWIVAIAAAVLVVLLAGALLLRNPIASFVATRALESQGLSCEPVQARIRSVVPPSPIELAPMRCESSEGPLQSIHFHAPLYVDLDGFGIALVHSESVTIALRAQPHRDVELNALGDITSIFGLDKPAVELMFDSGQMSARKMPPFLAARANVLRADRSIATLSDMRVTPMHAGMLISAREIRIGQISALGVASLQMTASPDRVFADFHFHSKLRVKVTAENMRAHRPTVRFEIGVGKNDSSGKAGSEK
jgi:hypothetical protein